MPSRSAAREMPIESMPSPAKRARRIATPPASTSARSGCSPSSFSRLVRPASIIALRSLRSGFVSMVPSAQPCRRRISATALMVPEAPTHSVHSAAR